MHSVRNSTLIALFAVLARAQAPIEKPADAKVVEQAIDDPSPGKQLTCQVRNLPAVLNFAFRFELRYIVDCSLAQFEGRPSQIVSYIRVKPRGRSAIILGDRFRLPEMPTNRREAFRWNRFHEQAEWSGVFTAGEGEYPVDLLVMDDRGRLFRKSWKEKAQLHGKERMVHVAMTPNTAASASVMFWSDNPDVREKGPRIDVLLDAAPVFPKEMSLRAWDRAFLMNSLSSLLRTLHPDSVRVTGFNLDQQREFFEEENFTPHSFRKLFRSLQQLELGSVSYRNLRQGGWSEMLTNLITTETKRDNRPEAIIFLGPSARILDKLPRQMLSSSCENGGPPIFYFKFSALPGNEFPDAIHHLTNACHGTVFTLHNAGDFAEAITKMQRKIRPELARGSTPAVNEQVP